MEVRDPSADIRLLEFCVGIPGAQYYLHGGERMLIRNAMDGILTDAIRWNTRTGRQAADIVFRLERDQKGMKETLSRLESTVEVSRYLDVEFLKREWLDILRRFPCSNTAKIYKFLRVINIGCFLASHSKRSCMVKTY